MPQPIDATDLARKALASMDPPGDRDRWLATLAIARAAGVDYAFAAERNQSWYGLQLTPSHWQGLPNDRKTPGHAANWLAKAAGIADRIGGNGPYATRPTAPAGRPVAKTGPLAKPPPYVETVDWPDTVRTLGDLAQAPIWFIADGKKGACWVSSTDGQRYAMMQSAGGKSVEALTACKDGGTLPPSDRVPYERRMVGWRSHPAIVDLIKTARRKGVAGSNRWRPAIALTGTDEVPRNDRLLLFDCDYKPANDAEGGGRRYRDGLLERCRAAGLPCFSSTSGNGYHAIARYDMPPRTRIYRKGIKNYFAAAHGCQVELFTSGQARLVAVLTGKPIGRKNTGDMPIPALTQAELVELLHPTGDELRPLA